MKVMARKHFLALCLVHYFLLCLLSCGLEEFLYLDYIPEMNVDIRTNDVIIRLPSSGAEGYNSYFDNFLIFYRIYMSGINPVAKVETPQQRIDINPTLNSDYTSIYPSTDQTSTTVNTSNLANTFFSRRYYLLTLEDEDINSVLSDGSLGRELQISFSSVAGEQPTLSLDGGTPYVLQRAVEGPGIIFSPKPDNLYFLNHPDLYDSANATIEINADVAFRTLNNPPTRYTYISMYIAATGRSYLTTLYSQPTFIGIFKLPEY